jgi:hypothetical protein
LRSAFRGQVTGLLDVVDNALAHHSFHVLVVYPWIRYLDRDAFPALNVLQQCRIRWGTVLGLHGDHVEILSRPLIFEAGRLELGEPVAEIVRWRSSGSSLNPPPRTGQIVSAHWGWMCAELDDADSLALEHATRLTIEQANAARSVSAI